jgi:hypothetical protein
VGSAATLLATNILPVITIVDGEPSYPNRSTDVLFLVLAVLDYLGVLD